MTIEFKGNQKNISHAKDEIEQIDIKIKEKQDKMQITQDRLKIIKDKIQNCIFQQEKVNFIFSRFYIRNL